MIRPLVDSTRWRGRGKNFSSRLFRFRGVEREIFSSSVEKLAKLTTIQRV